MLSGKWHVLIKGKKAPILGRICMDMTVVRCPAGIKTGDEALIFGRDKYAELPVEALAQKAGTIPYEIMTGIAERVRRDYSGF